MPINSFKEDEQNVETSKMKTLLRLFSYLLAYKKEIVFVLLIMTFCVGVTLLNPLIIEAAIDDYIGQSDWKGLCKLCLFAFVINACINCSILFGIGVFREGCYDERRYKTPD